MGRLIHFDYTVDLGHKPEAGEETNAAWKQGQKEKHGDFQQQQPLPYLHHCPTHQQETHTLCLIHR